MTEPQLFLENQLCFRLYNVSKEVTKAYSPILKDNGITYPQYLVLLVLWQQETAIKVSEIGARLNLDSGTLSPLLKRLEKSELVKRTRAESDERTVLISLTDQGKNLKNNLKNVPNALAERSPLSHEEMHQLTNLLDKMKEGLSCSGI